MFRTALSKLNAGERQQKCIARRRHYILPSYRYLMSLYSGASRSDTEPQCAPAGVIEDILGKILADLGDPKSIVKSSLPRRAGIWVGIRKSMPATRQTARCV